MVTERRNLSGVTLLETMLLLAIVGLLVVLSVRYYQSSSATQKANQVVQQVQSVVSSVDSVTVGKGTYSGINNSSILTLLPSSGLTLQWGGSITVTGSSTTVYTISISSVPKEVCPLVTAKLLRDSHLGSVAPTCNSTTPTNLNYTYTSVI